HFGNNGDGLTNQQQQMLSPSGALFSNLLSLRNSASNLSSTAADWSLDYKKTFKKEGRELEFLYSSSYGSHSSYAMQQQDYISGAYPSQGTISNNPGHDRQTQFSLDYTDPISKQFQLETGAKVTLESLNNNVVTDTLLNNGAYVNNPLQTYGFNYSRKIYAAYLSGTFKLFDFFDGKAGMRYERTTTTADFPETHIPVNNIWAPSLVLSHKLDRLGLIKFV
ncbi:MAG TPA: outer membrane beta-barrel protein, partial [Mucilaginibacter sp.]|nr:outer membrane beta-barrel protein [Mucilaginibacter sp.]